jgi:hypothetical protein
LAAASPARVFAEVARYRLTDEPSRITTPLLITECGGGGHWPKQSPRLHEQTAADTVLIVAKEDGRGRDRQLLDWLEGFLSR